MASGTVTVNIVGNASSLKGALAESESALGTFSSKVSAMGSKLSSFGSSMTMKVTLPIVAGLGLATKAAADEDQQMAVLAKTLKDNIPGATDATVKANEDWITSMQDSTGIMDDELRPAMGKLLIAGRDITEAHNDMAIAADLATARHIPLETVVNAMAKAAQGSTGALGKLGVVTHDAAGNALTYDEILQGAAKTMGGSAATAAATTAGKLAILKAKFADLGENIGRIVIPWLEKAADFIGRLMDKFESLSPTVQKFIVIGLAVAAAIGPVVGIVGALATAIGFLISPVGLVILAVAALVAGLIYAYTHFQTFHDIVDNVISGVHQIIENFVGFVEAVWRNFGDQITEVAQAVWSVIYGIVKGTLEQINGVINIVMGIIHGDWGQVWDGIQGIVQGAWDQIKSIVVGALEALYGFVSAGLEAIVALVGGLPASVVGALGDLSGLLFSAGKNLIQGFLDGIGSMFSAVKDLLGSLTSKLTSWKGPPGVDAKLLFGSGQLVIGGFIKGMESMYGDVHKTLGGLTGSMAGAAPAGPMMGNGGGVEHIHIHIDGNEVASVLRRRERALAGSSL